MAKHAVRAELAGDRLTVHISGPRVEGANRELLENCINELMDCADKHDCFSKGFNINCLATIARHNASCGCVEQAFGLAKG